MVLAMKQTVCKNISPHLIGNTGLIVEPLISPLFFCRQMVQGINPDDGGNLLLGETSYFAFQKNEPMAMPYVKRFVGAFEMLHNRKRWCLWLVDASEDILELPMVADRIDRCQKIRMDSASRFPNRDMAKLVSNPHLFREKNIDFNSAVVIPRHLTENASRMPVDIVDCSFVVGSSCSLIPDGDIIDFAFLSSAMHMAWVKCICGRLEARLRHSVSCCYNTFPVPEISADDRIQLTEICERILAERHSLQTEFN